MNLNGEEIERLKHMMWAEIEDLGADASDVSVTARSSLHRLTGQLGRSNLTDSDRLLLASVVSKRIREMKAENEAGEEDEEVKRLSNLYDKIWSL